MYPTFFRGGGGMKSAQSDDISSHTFRQISRISHFKERWKDNSLNIHKFFLLVPFKEKNPKDTTAEREREREISGGILLAPSTREFTIVRE